MRQLHKAFFSVLVLCSVLFLFTFYRLYNTDENPTQDPPSSLSPEPSEPLDEGHMRDERPSDNEHIENNSIVKMYEQFEEDADDTYMIVGDNDDEGDLLSYSIPNDGDFKIPSFRKFFYGNSKKRLTRVLRKYTTMHRMMADGRLKPRVVIVHMRAQLGNRLLGALSGMLFGLLTQRAVLLDDAGFYCSMLDLFEKPGFDFLVQRSSISLPSNRKLIKDPDGKSWRETNELLCSSLDESYTEDVVDIHTGQYLAPYMIWNPHYRQDLLDLFGVGEKSVRGTDIDVASPLLHYFLRPRLDLVSERDEFIEENFVSKFVVGLQVRYDILQMPDRSKEVSDSLFNLFFDAGNDAWGRHIEAHPELESRETGLRYFIATDMEKSRKMIKAFRKEQWENGDIIFCGEDFLLSDHPRGVQVALLDIMLLAASHDRVHSMWSTYGYIAAAYAGQQPPMLVTGSPTREPSEYLVYDNPNYPEQDYMAVPFYTHSDDMWVRLTTYQPCFHKFAVWGLSKAKCFDEQMIVNEMLEGRYC